MGANTVPLDWWRRMVGIVKNWENFRGLYLAGSIRFQGMPNDGPWATIGQMGYCYYRA